MATATTFLDLPNDVWWHHILVHCSIVDHVVLGLVNHDMRAHMEMLTRDMMEFVSTKLRHYAYSDSPDGGDFAWHAFHHPTVLTRSFPYGYIRRNYMQFLFSVLASGDPKILGWVRNTQGWFPKHFFIPSVDLKYLSTLVPVDPRVIQKRYPGGGDGGIPYFTRLHSEGGHGKRLFIHAISRGMWRIGMDNEEERYAWFWEFISPVVAIGPLLQVESRRTIAWAQRGVLKDLPVFEDLPELQHRIWRMRHNLTLINQSAEINLH